MEKPRSVETGRGSFYGGYLNDQVLPVQYFLRQLKQIDEWERFMQKLLRLDKGGGVVMRPPFDPSLLSNVELFACLYNLTERQVAVHINVNLPAKYFVGQAVDKKAPDHSTLMLFRERLIQRGKLKVFEEMLKEIVQIELWKGIKLGSIQIVDGVHSIVDVNMDKDQKRQDKGDGLCDTDARWGGAITSTSIRSRTKKAKRKRRWSNSMVTKHISA